MFKALREAAGAKARWIILFVALSAVFVIVARIYKRSNTPLWRVQLPNPHKVNYQKTNTLTFTPQGKQFLVADTQFHLYEFDLNGGFKFLKRTDNVGRGPNGSVYFEGVSIHKLGINGEPPSDCPKWKVSAPQGFIRDHPPATRDAERAFRINWPTLQIIGSDARGPVHLWDMRGRQPQTTLMAPALDLSTVNDSATPLLEAPYDVALSDDGQWCAVTYGLIHVRKWPSTIKDLSYYSEGVDFRQVGAVTVIFDLKTKKHRVLNPQAYISMANPPSISFGLSQLKFSPKGTYLAVSEGSRLSLWEVFTGKRMRSCPLPSSSIPQDNADNLTVFSPNERLVAYGGANGHVEVFEVQSGEHIQTFNCAAKLNNLAFSPDGQRLIVGCYEGFVYCWDMSGV